MIEGLEAVFNLAGFVMLCWLIGGAIAVVVGGIIRLAQKWLAG